MFDKNFKIKVTGNWCEYQPNKHIDLREIISFECWADQLGNPYRFHLKNGSYHYIERYEIGKQIENVLKEQQAKVEEQAQEISNLKSLIQGHELRHQQNLSIKQKLTRRSEELQKRVDAALAVLTEYYTGSYDESPDLVVDIEQALKGEGQ
ncbi:hypothetical protein [Acinetobacter baumannii]|uniref:hypothetical protein n=1 Tax=Acinetobacter baumannii TaxID=470 RepID=UPI0034E19E6D